MPGEKQDLPHLPERKAAVAYLKFLFVLKSTGPLRFFEFESTATEKDGNKSDQQRSAEQDCFGIGTVGSDRKVLDPVLHRHTLINLEE
jgi:hypothetical protein